MTEKNQDLKDINKTITRSMVISCVSIAISLYILISDMIEYWSN